MRRITMSLLLLNLGVLIALLIGPRTASGQDEKPPYPYQPCCASGVGAAWCCADCCFKMSCESTKQCRPAPAKKTSGAKQTEEEDEI